MPTLVTFSSQKLSCVADLYLPQDLPQGSSEKDSNGWPTVIMAHGFSGQRDMGLRPFADRFCEAGFAVLLFDYRCFGSSEGQPRQLLNPWMQLDDWRAAVAYVRKHNSLDNQRIFLWGSSFSGGHVVSLAAEDHALAGIIAQVPFVSGLALTQQLPFKDLARMGWAALKDQWAAWFNQPAITYPVVTCHGDRAFLNTPECYPGFERLAADSSGWQNAVPARIGLQLAFYNPIFKARQVQCPAQIIAATQDSLIPYSLVCAMAERIPNSEQVTLQSNHFTPYFDSDFETNIDHQLGFLLRHAKA